MRALVLLSTLVLLLAGCGAPGADDPDGPGDLDDGADAAGQTDRTMHELTWAPAFTAVVGNETGAFQPNENGAAQLLAGTDVGAARTHDLDVPAGPVVVRLTLVPDPPTAALLLDLDAPDDAIRTRSCECPQGGTQVYEAAVVLPAGGTVTATVFNANPEPVAVAYTLKTEVYGSDTVVPSGIPVAVTLPAGAHVMVAAAGESTSDVLVFGPDDALVTVLAGGAETRFDLDDRAPGEYVLVQQGHGVGARYRLGLPDGEPRYRLLGQTVTASDVLTTQAGQETTWTLDGGPGLLGLGACLSTSPGATSDTALVASGPDGEVLRSTVGGVAGVFTLDCPSTRVGDERLVPGTYTFSYSNAADSGSTVQGWLVHYAR